MLSFTNLCLQEEEEPGTEPSKIYKTNAAQVSQSDDPFASKASQSGSRRNGALASKASPAGSRTEERPVVEDSKRSMPPRLLAALRERPASAKGKPTLIIQPMMMEDMIVQPIDQPAADSLATASPVLPDSPKQAHSLSQRARDYSERPSGILHRQASQGVGMVVYEDSYAGGSQRSSSPTRTLTAGTEMKSSGKSVHFEPDEESEGSATARRGEGSATGAEDDSWPERTMSSATDFFTATAGSSLGSSKTLGCFKSEEWLANDTYEDPHAAFSATAELPSYEPIGPQEGALPVGPDASPDQQPPSEGIGGAPPLEKANSSSEIGAVIETEVGRAGASDSLVIAQQERKDPDPDEPMPSHQPSDPISERSASPSAVTLEEEDFKKAVKDADTLPRADSGPRHKTGSLQAARQEPELPPLSSQSSGGEDPSHTQKSGKFGATSSSWAESLSLTETTRRKGRTRQPRFAFTMQPDNTGEGGQSAPRSPPSAPKDGSQVAPSCGPIEDFELIYN